MRRENKSETLFLHRAASDLVEHYAPETTSEIQDILRMLYSEMLSLILENELSEHLKDTPDNFRNGYTQKTIRTIFGEIPVKIPRDRQSTFTPKSVPKRTRTLPELEHHIWNLHKKGLSQRMISFIVEEFYNCTLSYQTVADIIKNCDNISHT